MHSSRYSLLDKLSGKRVLVTGATGFIGSHIARRLRDEGAHLGLLVRPGSDLSRLDDLVSSAVLLEGDIVDAAKLEPTVREFDPQFVFHLAAYTQVGREFSHADEALRNNFGGTINLLRTLEGTDISRIVTAGTCEEYGDGKQPLTEESPLLLVSPYSVSKAAATLWAQMVFRTSNLPIVVVRPFLCYGPGQEPCRLIPQAILAALENRDFPMTAGEQTREFTHVSDMVEGFMRASVAEKAVGEVINLGSAEEYPVSEVVQMIFEIAESKARPQLGAVPYRAAEMWRCLSSNEKAKRLLDWSPTISLRDGLVDTISWYRENLTT